MFTNEQDIVNWLWPDDILIVDRGFRDSISSIKSLGYDVVMPSFLNRRKQFTTYEANENRLITKIRWVIESGMILDTSHFRMFYSTLHSKQSNKAMEILQLRHS